MAKDLTVILEDRPGTAADMGEAMGKAGVNMEGGCGFRSEGKGVIHILVEDAVAARRALQQAGIKVRDEREVLVVKIEDRPGVMGNIYPSHSQSRGQYRPDVSSHEQPPGYRC